MSWGQEAEQRWAVPLQRWKQQEELQAHKTERELPLVCIVCVTHILAHADAFFALPALWCPLVRVRVALCSSSPLFFSAPTHSLLGKLGTLLEDRKHLLTLHLMHIFVRAMEELRGKSKSCRNCSFHFLWFHNFVAYQF